MREAITQIDKILRCQRLFAQIVITTPQQVLATQHHLDLSMPKNNRLSNGLLILAKQLSKCRFQSLGLVNPIALLKFPWVKPVVFATINAHYLHMPLEGFNSR